MNRKPAEWEPRGGLYHPRSGHALRAERNNSFVTVVLVLLLGMLDSERSPG